MNDKTLIILLILGAAGFGAWWYLKEQKRKILLNGAPAPTKMPISNPFGSHSIART